jgi:hypothetical protein
VRAGGDVSNGTAKRRAEILEKIEACTARIGVTQARIDARKEVGLDASDDEKWLATELDFLSIFVDVLKGLKRSNGSE